MTTAGSSSDGLAELVDLYPTLAELCHVTPPKDLQGRSLAPRLKDPKGAGKDIAYTVVSRGPRLGQAIRTDRWRYARWPDGEELYDLTADRHEHKNLAGSKQHAAILNQLRDSLTEIDKTAAANRKPTLAK